MMKYRILIVEDEETIAGEIAKALTSWGLEAHRVQDFNQGAREFAQLWA